MTVIIFVLILSVLVLVHELGHFTAAKLLGIKVEEFAFGLPFTPPILKLKYRGTQYAVYPIFFGGFVRLQGEEGPVSKEKSAYWNRSKKQRIAVLLAGVTMNVLLAFAGFVILYGALGIPVRQTDKLTLIRVEEGSPAAVAGLAIDDRIVEVEGKKVGSTTEFSQLIESWKGLGVNLTVQRGKGIALFEGIAEQDIQQIVVNVVPREKPPEGQGSLGIVFASFPYLETEPCRGWGLKCLGGAVGQGMKTTGLWVGRVFEGLREIGKSLSAGKAPEGVAGPVGIYQLTGLVAAEGSWPLLELVAVLSVNLAVFNILPIPAMDGGRLFFVLTEWVFKKRIKPETEQKINSWGMAFLIGLMLLITLQDVIRLVWAGK